MSFGNSRKRLEPISAKRRAKLEASGRRAFSTFSPRKPMKFRPPKRLERRAADQPYLAFIRSLNCISCGSTKRSEAAHMPFGPRGMGLKSPDQNTVPLCRACHRWFDGHTVQVLSREERRDLAAKWLEAVRLLVTPGDSRDHARDLEEMGLGRIVEREGGRWEWVPAGGEEMA